MKITIVIPTFNEVENLPKLTKEILTLPLQTINLIYIDDNSPDGTGKVADKLAQEYPGRIEVIHRSGKLGLGTAYITGFQRALSGDAEVIGQMDADFSHPPAKLVEMIKAFPEADLVIGSRYISGGSLDDQWPAWRKFLSQFANFYARTILCLPMKDTTGAYRLWKRETLLKMPLDQIRSNGYVFMVECAHIANQIGMNITEVPIHFTERVSGVSKMSLRVQLEAAFRVWQLRFRKF